MNAIVRATLIAPLLVVPVSLLYLLPGLVLGGSNFFEVLQKILPYFSMCALLFAYTAMLVVGLPSYFIARRKGAVGYPAALLAAVVASAAAAVIPAAFSPSASIFLPFFIYLLFAVPIALAFVKIVTSDGRQRPRSGMWRVQ